jgi:hypothetical protein
MKDESTTTEDLAQFKFIRIKVNTGNGQARIVNDNGTDIEASFEPLPPGKQKEIYQSAAGFRVVGTLYHSHASPGCLYWNGSQPIIIPC